VLNARDAWDMAAEMCLSKLPQLIANPNAEFQVFFSLTFYSTREEIATPFRLEYFYAI
jgi:hypothetical protein